MWPGPSSLRAAFPGLQGFLYLCEVGSHSPNIRVNQHYSGLCSRTALRFSPLKMYLWVSCFRDSEIWRSACLRVWGRSCTKMLPFSSWREMFLERPRVRFDGKRMCLCMSSWMCATCTVLTKGLWFVQVFTSVKHHTSVRGKSLLMASTGLGTRWSTTGELWALKDTPLKKDISVSIYSSSCASKNVSHRILLDWIVLSHAPPGWKCLDFKIKCMNLLHFEIKMKSPNPFSVTKLNRVKKSLHWLVPGT